MKVTVCGLTLDLDEEDIEKVKNLAWCLSGSKGIVQTSVKGKTISIARFLMQTDAIYDHKDRDKFNNQKDNLRLTTHSQNNANKGKRQDKIYSSQYKGVNCLKDKRYGYKASIRVRGRGIHLGYFYTEIEAAEAYNQAALKYFKEFAVLNDIRKVG